MVVVVVVLFHLLLSSKLYYLWHPCNRDKQYPFGGDPDRDPSGVIIPVRCRERVRPRDLNPHPFTGVPRSG